MLAGNSLKICLGVISQISMTLVCIVYSILKVPRNPISMQHKTKLYAYADYHAFIACARPRGIILYWTSGNDI